jgi:hypothetical protein
MAIITQTQGGQSSAAVNGQSLDYITQQVLQQCPGCPDTLAESVLQNVIRDFYYKSTGWREVIGPYTIVPGVQNIALNPVDQYSQVHLVLDVFVYPDTSGGNTPRHLNPAARQIFGNQTGAPLTYSLQGSDTLVLYPIPDQLYGNILYIYASLMPVLNVGQLPNISITHHFDGLFYGTLHRLCSMPNKSWTVKDRDTLNDWKRMAAQNRLLARDIAERGFSPADGKLWFPNFAGRMSQNPNSAGGRTF